jgi:hypothetical protein
MFDPIVVTPDEKTAVARTKGSLVAFDIEARRVLWRRDVEPRVPVDPPHPYLRSSLWTSGRAVIYAERLEWNGPVALAILEATSGRELAHVAIDETRPGLDLAPGALAAANGERCWVARSLDHVHAVRLVALSDDGAWLASALGTPADAGAVALSRLGAGAAPLLLEDAGHPVLDLAFEPGGARLAVARRGGGVAVYAREGEAWREAARIADAAEPRWTAAGLFVAVRGGPAQRDVRELEDFPLERARQVVRIALYAGAERQTGPLALPKNLNTSPDEEPPSWRPSPDGAFVACWGPSRLAVLDARTGAVLARAERFGWAAEPIVGLAFRGRALRFLTFSGLVVDLDLARGEETRRESFGEIGHGSRGFVDTSSYETYYVPAALSPGGKYAAIERAKSEAALVLLDE